MTETWPLGLGRPFPTSKGLHECVVVGRRPMEWRLKVYVGNIRDLRPGPEGKFWFTTAQFHNGEARKRRVKINYRDKPIFR